jgi:micrococcal nuclease
VRWLPLLVVSGLVIAVLVASDPDAIRLSCAPGREPEEWTRVVDEEFIGPCALRRVIDGDTLDVVCDGEPQRVRLLRVDTPEREEPGYAAATAALRRLVAAGELRLVLEVADEPVRDRHGRLLAYAYAGGRNLNVELVRLGWSAFDSRFGEGRFARAFEAAEHEARAAARGLWAAEPR